MTVEGSTKSFELERGKESWNALKSLVLSKNDVKNANLVLRYQAARGEYYEINSDQQLQHALKDASSNGTKIIELKTPGHGATYTSTPATSAASTPVKSATATPTHQKPSSSNTPASSPSAHSNPSTPTSAPGNRTANHSDLQSGDYHVVTWDIAGDASAPLNKPKVSYGQTHDEFSFWPLPCQHHAETRVVLRDSSSLIFESVYTFEDVSFGGVKGVSTSKVTQTIGLPIKVSPNLIVVEGQKIIIRH